MLKELHFDKILSLSEIFSSIKCYETLGQVCSSVKIVNSSVKIDTFSKTMIDNKFFIFVTVFVIGWGRFCECQVFFGGECLDLETVKNFDVAQFMGLWYEYKRYPSDLEKTSKCNTDTFELRDTGDVTILKSRYNTVSKSYVENLGTASGAESGHVKVEFVDTAAAARSRFWVLDTDYTNYSVLYACTPITNHYHTKMVWIMTREQFPKAEAVVKAFQTLSRNRLDISYLQETDQTECVPRTGVIDKFMAIP